MKAVMSMPCPIPCPCKPPPTAREPTEAEDARMVWLAARVPCCAEAGEGAGDGQRGRPAPVARWTGTGGG